MGPNNRAVDLGILVVCLGSQHFKDSLPDTSLAPAHVASMNHPKVAKAFGQITLGDTNAITIEHCLEEWDFSSIGKEKMVFSSKKNDIHQTIKCLFDDRP